MMLLNLWLNLSLLAVFPCEGPRQEATVRCTDTTKVLFPPFYWVPHFDTFVLVAYHCLHLSSVCPAQGNSVSRGRLKVLCPPQLTHPRHLCIIPHSTWVPPQRHTPLHALHTLLWSPYTALQATTVHHGKLLRSALLQDAILSSLAEKGLSGSSDQV